MLRKEQLLIVALVLLLTLGFVLRNFPFTSGRLHDDVLPVKSTNDAFWHEDYGDWVIRAQDARFLPPHWAQGMKSYTAYYVEPYVLTSAFAQFTNIPNYQMTFLVFNLMAVFQGGVLFVLVRRFFNAEMALLATTLSLFPATAAWLFGQYIGFWFDTYDFLLVLVTFFFLSVLIARPGWKVAALMGIIMAAQFLGHPVYVAFVVVFIILVTGALLLLRRMDIKLFTRMAAVGMIFIVIGSYPLALFVGQSFLGTSVSSGNVFALGKFREKPGYFPDFTVPPILLLLGAAGFALFFLMQHPAEKKIPRYLLLAFIVFWALVGFSNIIGYKGSLAYRALMSAYILLAVLPALAINFIIAFAAKRMKMPAGKPLMTLVAAGIVIALFFSPVYAALSQVNSQSFIDAERWDTFMWVRKNTPLNATIFTLNGYLHSVGGKFSQRPEMKGDLNVEYHIQNIINICNGMQNDTLPETYLGWCTSIDSGGKVRIERTGLTSYRYEKGKLCDLPPYIAPDGTETMSLIFPLEHVDYVLLQYRDTGWDVGQNYDPCMAFFINKTLERGFEIVYPNAQHPNSKMMVLKVNTDG